MAAVALAQAIQTIVSRNVEALKSAVISITQIHSGSAYNVIPKSATLCGTIRTFDKDVLALVTRRMNELAKGIGVAYGVEVEAIVHPGCAAVINSVNRRVWLAMSPPRSSAKQWCHATPSR